MTVSAILLVKVGTFLRVSRRNRKSTDMSKRGDARRRNALVKTGR
jgi:hypothetical protein